MDYSLRVPADPAPSSRRIRPGNSGVLEQAAARIGFAPPLVHGERRAASCYCAGFGGDTWTEDAVRQSRTLHQMARLLRTVHSLPIPTATARSDPADWIESYTAAFVAPASGAAEQRQRALRCESAR